MAIKKRTVIIIIFLTSVLIIAALCVQAWFYLSDKVARLDSYRDVITKTAAEKFNRVLSYETGKATLTLRNGLSVQFTNVVISEKDGSADFLSVKDAFIRVNILPLLRNRLVLGKVVLSEPRVSVKRDSMGVLNIADLLKREMEDKTPKIRKLVIEKGRATFLDEAAGKEALKISLENVNGQVYSPFWTKKSYFRIKTSVIEGKNKAGWVLRGSYRPAPLEKPIYESKVKASIYVKGTNLRHYVSYLEKYTPLKQWGGFLNADIKLSGKFSDFKTKGSIIVKKASLNYPGVFNGIVRPRIIEVDYSLKRDTESLGLDVSHLAVDNFNAKGSFDIDDLDKEDPFLTTSAITSVFVLKEVKSYVPWGIIPKDVGGFIQEHVKDGKFRLVEGTLKGRLSHIAHMYSKESKDALFIKAQVEKGIFEAGGPVPVFHDITGVLELKKRQFSLKRMKGFFGNSPCTMEGSISDFALPEPNVYTAEMKIQPVRDEVLWLLGKEKFSKLDFKGASVLYLSGQGPADDFHINADWDLTNAAYIYPDVLEKPRARKNNIDAKIVINDDAVNFTSFKYDLPPIKVNAAAIFSFSGKMPLSFNIQSRAFDAREAVPILPVLREFKPTGKCSLAVGGRGDLSDTASIQWNGEITLSGISLQPSNNVSPLKDLTGKVFFKGKSLETSLWKVRIGESYIQGNFSIDDLSQPKIDCQFNTNLLQTKDLGLQTPKGGVDLYAVKGKIGFENKILHVDNLSFVLGQSSINFSGDISDWASPKITAELSSPYVTSDDFVQLFSLRYPKKEQEVSAALELNATLHVNDGKFNDIEFKELFATLKFTRGIVDVETLEAELFDGKFMAKGRAYINPGGKNNYETNILIDKMSLEKIQSYLEMGDSTITGELSVSGDLSTTGRDSNELKQTAAGVFDVLAEKGVLKRFSILSKIFSMLNVAQLAKLQLPDMAKGGMPYKKITFHTSLKGGVFSSKDFFINSDAIQFSGVGNVDFLNKKLDCVVGVHPLQTLDLVASKVPIAGWIITDERGKLITVNFKIGGTWDNPEVTTITAKSIGKGTLDIFKRIFKLPEKLITDTGEVIFGH
ncbi:MAG: AsmA-like C-terminal domain-containing protein [Syntrophaceae bacterium]|nr:AsmA-like C-terminal domain-containing protein [Syntrophaceae bacterium]